MTGRKVKSPHRAQTVVYSSIYVYALFSTSTSIHPPPTNTSSETTTTISHNNNRTTLSLSLSVCLSRSLSPYPTVCLTYGPPVDDRGPSDESSTHCPL